MKNNMAAESTRKVSMYDLSQKVIDGKYEDAEKYLNKEEWNNSYLVYIALVCNDKRIKKIAISKVSSERMLYIALLWLPDEEMKFYVLSKISSQEVLMDVALYEGNESVGIKALEMLGLKKLITTLAYHGISDEIRIKALDYITNENELEKIALCEFQYDRVRKCAISKIKNERILKEVKERITT